MFIFCHVLGINDDTGKKTVGFRLGSYVQGSTSIAPIHGVPNVPEQMQVAVNAFQNFIQNSKYDVFNSESHQGKYSIYFGRAQLNLCSTSIK